MSFIREKLKNERNREIAIYALFSLAILLLIFYGYFIQSSIIFTVERETLGEKVALISSEISSLEAEYLSDKAGLTIDLAGKLGLKEDFNKVNFANVGDGLSRGRLSFLNNEI